MASEERRGTSQFVSTLFAPGSSEAGSEPLGFLTDRPRRDWLKLLDHMETRRFSEGDVLVTAGDRERSLILLTGGAVGVRLAAAQSTYAVFQAPAVLGEVAFLDGGPRSATLYAVSAGEYLRLSRDRFEVLSAREPHLAQAIVLDLARIVTRRLRATNDALARRREAGGDDGGERA